MSGYRLSADDVMFYWNAIQGWDKVWKNASEMAVFSGRIGHYLMTPLNSVGAYLAGNLYFRGLMVLGHFGLMFVFCIYVTRLLAQENRFATFLLFFLILLSINPLTYGHMPPNSYPLQNTVPFLMILGGRLLMLRNKRVGLVGSVWVYLTSALAMLVSEYALLFATALMAAEHSLTLNSYSNVGFKRLLGRFSVNVPKLSADAGVAFGVLAIYIGYRWLHPSQYVGNQPDGLSHIDAVFHTALGHIYAGLTFPYLDISTFMDAGILALMQAFLVGTITFACSSLLVTYIPFKASARIPAILLVTVTLMLYMAFPLAVTEKMQDWCLNGSSCAYLDSRVSFLGVTVLVFCVIILIKRASTGFLQITVLRTFSVGLGILAAATHLNNQQTAESMAENMVPWERAKDIACSDGVANITNAAAWRLVDPENV